MQMVSSGWKPEITQNTHSTAAHNKKVSSPNCQQLLMLRNAQPSIRNDIPELSPSLPYHVSV